MCVCVCVCVSGQAKMVISKEHVIAVCHLVEAMRKSYQTGATVYL